MMLSQDQQRKLNQLQIKLQAELQLLQSSNTFIQNTMQRISLIQQETPKDFLTGTPYTAEQITAIITKLQTDVSEKFLEDE